MKLPSYQQLSKEQDAINNLPLTGSYLVIGPPGTGKTVLAVYRASMLKRVGRYSNFLVHGRPLRQYLEQATMEMEIDGIATTFHKWFYDWYPKHFHARTPQIEPYIFDWLKVYKSISTSTGAFEKYDHLIIDEGQDFPKEFYLVMKNLTQDVTVFADENQRITEQNSTIKDIQDYMGPQGVYKLTKNYRNTRPIAEFARTFYAGLPSGIPDLPTRNGPKPQVLSAPDLQSQISFIARYGQNNGDRDIAIFVATNEQQYRISRLLGAYQLQNPTQMYVSSNRDLKELNFQQPGIKILTYASAKGLEFDAVFLPELEKRMSDPDSDLERMRFYVMTSRAREELFLMFSGTALPPLLQCVAHDLFDMDHIFE